MLVAVAPTLVRCPVCSQVLGELLDGLLLVHHRDRTALCVFTSCHRRGCRGGWTSAKYQGVVDHARGLRRVV